MPPDGRTHGQEVLGPRQLFCGANIAAQRSCSKEPLRGRNRGGPTVAEDLLELAPNIWLEEVHVLRASVGLWVRRPTRRLGCVRDSSGAEPILLRG